MADKAEIANLQVVLSANTKALQDGLNRVAGAVDQMTQATQRGADRAGASLDRISRAADLAASTMRGALLGGVAAASAGFTQLAQSAISDLARIGREAQQAGVSTGALQGFQFALRQQGVEASNAGQMLAGFATKVREATAVEVDLEKTLAANNVSIRDKAGNLRPTIDVLAEFAEMVRNAATREEGLALATAAFGDAGKDLLPVLERGAAGIRSMQDEARAAGQVIDADLIKRADEFDRTWTAAWQGFGLRAKGAIAEAADALSQVITQAEKWLNRLGNANLFKAIGPSAEQMRAAGIEPMTREGLADSAVNAGQKRDAGNDLFIQLRAKGPATRMVSPSRGGGRGGGGGSDETTEADRAENRLNQYLKSLERAHAVEQARLETFGKSNAAQKAATELARAMPDLNRLDAETKQKLTEAIIAQIEKIEAAREAHERLKLAQEAVRDAAKGMADMMAGAIEDLVINGTKAQDVLKNLGKSLASSSLKALLTGEGPLAGLFGTKGVNGAPGGALGGLFTALFSGFGGGASVPKLASGTSYVPRDMFAQIHRGEMVVPAYDAAQMRNGGGGRAQVIINNNAPVSVAAQESQGPLGPRIDVIIDQRIAAAQAPGGSLYRQQRRMGFA